MTKELIAAGFVLALSLPGAALAADAASLDADGDGVVSMSEFEAAMPEAEAGTFAQIDADADGALSEQEVADAVEAGVLPQEG